jgi:hypothetical protein
LKPSSRLAEKRLPVSVHGLEISSVARVLRKNGYSCSVAIGLLGGSGEIHLFDFVARKDGERIAITGFDFQDDETASVEMVKLRVKTLDASPAETIIVLKSDSTKLREFASDYGFIVVDATSDGSVYEKLDATLKSLEGNAAIEPNDSIEEELPNHL